MAEKTPRERALTLQKVFEAVDIPTIVVDDEENVVIWNRAEEELVGIERAEITGEENIGTVVYDGDRETILAEKVARHPETAHEVYDGIAVADQQYALLDPGDAHIYEDTSTATGGSGADLWFIAVPLYEDGEFVGVLEFTQNRHKSARRREEIEDLVEELDETLRSFQAGDFSARADTDVGDTLLADEELAMLDRINDVARMREALEEQVRKTTEAKQELERSNERLQQFAYVASHDLQEPLRMVSSYMDLLESEYGDEFDEDAREYMAFARDGANRMQDMINGLLEYSRVQTQAGEFEPVDVEQVLARTEQDLQLLLDEHGATLAYGDLPTVSGDHNQLCQLFQNLVKNAIEHGKEATIEVTATETVDGWEFSVTDDGPGIPDHLQETLFDIFDKGADSDGTGIGLAICERIVERHEGSIRVESTPGEGTTFYVTLPTSDGTDT